MSDPKDSRLLVGVDSEGWIWIERNCEGRSYDFGLTLETAEWLRDRLFHICAHERALRKAAEEVPK